MKNNLLVIEDENSVAKQLKWGLGKEYELTLIVPILICDHKMGITPCQMKK